MQQGVFGYTKVMYTCMCALTGIAGWAAIWPAKSPLIGGHSNRMASCVQHLAIAACLARVPVRRFGDDAQHGDQDPRRGSARDHTLHGPHHMLNITSSEAH